jgi:hypothetical protein
MGLPEINITFNSLSTSAISRSARGIVALILRDDTEETFTLKEYTTITDIDEDDWTETSLQYIKDAFLGTPTKVIVVRGDVADTDYSVELATLATKKFDYLAVPGIETAAVASVSTWLKAERDNFKKTFKAVLPNSLSDHEGIINFATDNIVVGSNTYTASQYSARIAGILAGLSLERSATYFVLPEVSSVPPLTKAAADAAIDAGKLILIQDDNGKVKIARGVNSFTTFTPSKSKQFSKTKIVEGKDLIQNDIVTTFNDNYVGKMNNSYDNQVLFITAVNAYLRGLLGTVLDPSTDNHVSVDVEEQRQAWESIGTNTSELTDAQIKEKSFEAKIFMGGTLKFLDSIEDLQFKMNV